MAERRPSWPPTRRPLASARHPAGTSSGRPQSAILIPVPEAEEVVGRWRHRYDPVAAAGVPAHITLIVPWLRPTSIEEHHLHRLVEALRDVRPWDFELTRTNWFSRGVLWLAPTPAEPFKELTQRLAACFSTPPWAGEFDEIVPHLTVAHAHDDRVTLGPVVADLTRRLPVPCQAREVWVMCGDGRRWAIRAKIALLGAADVQVR